MGFFDKLLDPNAGIVGPTGNICGCFDEAYDGVTAGDMIRDLILNPDSVNNAVLSENEKEEFIYKLFRTFIIGGALCQPDHNIHR